MMFRANLIDTPDYYKLRRQLLLFGFLLSGFMGLLANFYTIPHLWLIIVLILTGLVFYYFFQTQKEVTATTGNRKIEIDSGYIRVKSNAGKILEEINLEQADRITVQETYGIPAENIHEVIKELRGENLQNVLIIHYKGHQRRFDFILDSYYMIEQLKKSVDAWKASGIRVDASTR
ncbi:MAG: hypothetical protein EP344_02735 [Bacteroidetes bacterium]|nr:MAG: hypothetical protein EP344_02735 [Bacteroidota bacterium]